MENYPLVSIIIITLNEEKNIIKCLESICDMNYPKNKIDLICVDSNSIDNSVKLIKDFPINKKLIVIENPLKAPSFGINIGLNYCKGEFVQIIGGDMMLEKNWLRFASNFFKTSGNNKLLYINGLIEEISDNEKKSIFKILYRLNLGGVKNDSVQCARGGGLFRIDLIRKYNIRYDDNLQTDDEVDIGIRASIKGFIFKNTPQIMVYHESEYKNNLDSLRSYISKLVILGKSRFLLLKKYFGKPEMKLFLKYIKLPLFFILLLVLSIISLILVFFFLRNFFYFFILFLFIVYITTFLFVSYKISKRKKVNLFISMLYVLNIFLLEFLISTSAMFFYLFKNFFIIRK